MKKIKRIISVITVLGLLLSTPITAFARTLYEQVKYLDDQEIFDGMWSELVTSQGTENEEATGNTFILSYYHQDLQDFLSSYKIPDGDFKLINLRDTYFEKIENSDTAIEPYSKKVFDYIAAHPDFELSWSFDTSKKEYTCYDKSELVIFYLWDRKNQWYNSRTLIMDEALLVNHLMYNNPQMLQKLLDECTLYGFVKRRVKEYCNAVDQQTEKLCKADKEMQLALAQGNTEQYAELEKNNRLRAEEMSKLVLYAA